MVFEAALVRGSCFALDPLRYGCQDRVALCLKLLEQALSVARLRRVVEACLNVLLFDGHGDWRPL